MLSKVNQIQVSMLNSLLVHTLYSLVLECSCVGWLFDFVHNLWFCGVCFLGVFLLQTLLEIKEPLVLVFWKLSVWGKAGS
jgi:hypothetical protein